MKSKKNKKKTKKVNKAWKKFGFASRFKMSLQINNNSFKRSGLVQLTL